MLLRNASPWDWLMVVCKQIWHLIVCRIRCLDRELFRVVSECLRTFMGREVDCAFESSFVCRFRVAIQVHAL